MPASAAFPAQNRLKAQDMFEQAETKDREACTWNEVTTQYRSFASSWCIYIRVEATNTNSFHDVAFQTVSMLVRLMMALPGPYCCMHSCSALHLDTNLKHNTTATINHNSLLLSRPTGL